MEDQVLLASESRPSDTLASFNGAHLTGESEVMNDQSDSRVHVLQIAWQDMKFVTTYIREHQASLAWVHIGVFFVLSVAVASSFYIVIPANNAYSQYCNPGGSFSFNNAYNPWDLEHTFQITLGFGKLSFTQAKVIDIVWDVVIGRGGQFLLVAFCFYVFSKSLNLILEQPKASISYDGFRAIVFEKPSLGSAFHLARDLNLATGWRSKVSILWMVLASIYVVAFPTMISAMSGYSSNVAPLFNNGGAEVPITGESFHRAIFRIMGADLIDGLRLNATYLVGSHGFGHPDYEADGDYSSCLIQPYQTVGWATDDCVLVHGIGDYLKSPGSSALNPNNATLSLPNGTLSLMNNLNYTIQPPGLTIEIFNTATLADKSFFAYTNEASLSNVSSKSPYMYTILNGTDAYNATYINNVLGTCVSQPTYLWGFSFILLFCFCVVTCVWAFGMYFMWVDYRRNSRLDRAGRRMGFYRGVIDVSNAIWKDTLTVPGELMSDLKIRRKLAQKLNGGRISFDEISLHELPPARGSDSRQFTQRVHSIKGWTKTWTLLHWLWYSFFTINGFIWFWPILSLMTTPPDISVTQSKLVLNLVFAGLLCLVALIMLLANILGLTKTYSHFPFIGTQSKSQPLIHWTWVVIFAVAGAVSLFVAFNAFNLYGFIIECILTGLFWVPAAIMLLIGLFSTLWRWIFQLAKAVLRPLQRKIE